MRKLFFLAISLIIIGFIFIIGCDQQSDNPVQADIPAQAPLSEIDDIGGIADVDNGPSASGQGSLIYGQANRRIFTFHAVTHPDGSVEGQGVYRRVSSVPEQRMQFEFYIDCLNVQDNMAIMSGMITKVVRLTYDPSDPVEVGQYIQFKVIDHGEGANAEPDEMSWFAHGPDVPPCDEDVGWDLFTIEAGNIQVKP